MTTTRERLEKLLTHHDPTDHLVPLAILAAAEIVADAIRESTTEGDA